MDIQVRAFNKGDIPAMLPIWNDVVEDGIAFPQLRRLAIDDGDVFFRSQSATAVAVNAESGEVAGLYILHPNNIGRCGHIANASYAVRRDLRGQHIGERLVTHSLDTARALGFRLMQFNAVVKSNLPALRLYRRLGFVQLGTIPGGFRMKDGSYADIVLMYYNLSGKGKR